MEGMDSARVKRLLGLPRQAVVTMVISAGKRRRGRRLWARACGFDAEHFVHKH